jgi:phosphopantothenoylcysteine decarboxylase/phosphopantothenate--cysteine ligase
MCAAVADAKPSSLSASKIKKDQLTTIELERNPDLLAQVSTRRTANQVIIGFAAETDNHLENAKLKLRDKDIDILYVNDVSHGAIFGSDVTKGSVVLRSGATIDVIEGSKDTLANVLLDQLV